MAYEPKVWKTNDLITAAALNNLEQGVANAGGKVFVVHVSEVFVPGSDEGEEEMA